jgi:RNA polymerase sigma factor (sigma-70 family)
MDNEQLKHLIQKIRDKSSGWRASRDQFAEWFIKNRSFAQTAYKILYNSHDVEDVMTEAFIKIDKEIRKGNLPIDDVPAWCRKIVKNKAIDFNRYEKKRKPGQKDKQLLVGIEGKGAPPGVAIEEDTPKRILAHTIAHAGLSELQAEVARFAWLEEETNDEIAERLEKSNRSVEQNKSRARQKMARYVITLTVDKAGLTDRQKEIMRETGKVEQIAKKLELSEQKVKLEKSRAQRKIVRHLLEFHPELIEIIGEEVSNQ